MAQGISSNSPVSAPQFLVGPCGIIDVCIATSGIYMSSEDLNSGCQACVASTSHSKPPSPMTPRCHSCVLPLCEDHCGPGAWETQPCLNSSGRQCWPQSHCWHPANLVSLREVGGWRDPVQGSVMWLSHYKIDLLCEKISRRCYLQGCVPWHKIIFVSTWISYEYNIKHQRLRISRPVLTKRDIRAQRCNLVAECLFTYSM